MDYPYIIDFIDNIRGSVVVETMYVQEEENPSLIDILGLGMGRDPNPSFKEGNYYQNTSITFRLG
ncbi:hypothetical protein [uncultured Shewanella sp.]|uniref:hypothetical protein n=1 Tax=uncultured Shewanella sp. TaxID=173975 RepID=UPI0026270EC1|nr:hypothetical protein [uncultured Shewanella sp.]